ncbi:Glucokinase [Rhodovulum sp. P5]|uniref:glucokinase n=1 Tax=Rhodovulum sp. P5 TaxID=1564506 RepID=UPI0009C33B94|nr:ROK family protein [Rhodovulum sp. P5]ARE41659.1 Glucokinase [Rhodovulum sp. P5]
MTALVADIGGTNTRVALAEGPEIVAGSVRRFLNAEHAGLYDVLRRFLAEMGHPQIDGACAAVAGPVRHGAGSLTNFDWDICEDRIGAVAGTTRVKLLNDLQAQGHALDHLGPDALTPVLDGPQEPGAPRLVIGIGTGFNSTTVYKTAGGTVVTAAECGHMSLPVCDERMLSLARFAAGADGFSDVEDILSGRGLETVYGWTTTAAGAPRTLPGREVLSAIGHDPQAAEALQVFVRMLGRVVGDLALAHLPYGGIYLIGGMARAVAPHLETHGFADSFRDKGRFSSLMEEFAILTVFDDFAALIGCAGYLEDGE